MSRRSNHRFVRYSASENTSRQLWWEAQHELTPRAIALYAAAWGVLLSAEMATAISNICTSIQEGG